MAGYDEAIDPERVHEVDRVVGQDAGIARPQRRLGQEPGGAEAAQERRHGAEACGVERRRDSGPSGGVVGPAVQQQDDGPLARPLVEERHVEELRFDVDQVHRLSPLERWEEPRISAPIASPTPRTAAPVTTGWRAARV